MTDYMKYRGKCKEYCERMLLLDDTLTLTKGWYDCPFEGKQEHWWLVNQEGKIIDPTRKQFLSNGCGGDYIEYKGYVYCEECGKKVLEADIQQAGRYYVCSTECHMKLVGLA